MSNIDISSWNEEDVTRALSSGFIREVDDVYELTEVGTFAVEKEAAFTMLQFVVDSYHGGKSWARTAHVVEEFLKLREKKA